MSKHFYKTIFFSPALLMGMQGNTQTVSTFSETVLTVNSYNNGSDLSGGFNSGNAFFPNSYDTSWGGYWASGWSISNIYDTVTQPSDFYTQLYNAKEVIPSTGDANFAVGTQYSRIILSGAAAGKVVNGFHVTNSTYAYNSMKLGDSFAKKFGGTSGTDPDYFKLVVKNYYGGVMGTDSVVFFLADYTFSTSSMDYIVDEWTWVDLTPLGNTDSLEFILRSTDVGSFGINTPLYYAIDNLTTADSPAAVADFSGRDNVSVYPNPFSNAITVNASGPINVVLRDASGKVILTAKSHNSIKMDSEKLSAGVYLLNVNGKTYKLIK
ncbi:MAG TPA: DUF4465 domain-containing protein [Flavobacteriales bacterium]|nr:DUF4465 domain-containing protein [Flavobacteriales bacterium]